MKELYLYLLESINIFESATGVKITNKNINTIIDYLSEYQYGVKCIIPDTDEIRNNYIELEEWFCGYNDISKALFFLKSNGMLCMYEPNVKSMSDKELEDLHITRKGEAYYLPGITTKLEATSKKLNSAKTNGCASAFNFAFSFFTPVNFAETIPCSNVKIEASLSASL